MTAPDHEDFVDRPTAAVLGVEPFLERIEPRSAPGRERLRALPIYTRSDREAWRAEIDALQRLEDWLDEHPDPGRDLIDKIGRLPSIDGALRRLEAGEHLGEGDLFDLKQFAYYGRRALESADDLAGRLDAPDDGARRLRQIVRLVHPGGGESPRFHLTGELDEELDRRIDERRRAEDALREAREELADCVADDLGGSVGMRGRYRPPEEADDERLRDHPHLEERGTGWYLDSDRLDELEAALTDARDRLEETERRVRDDLTDRLADHRDWLADAAEFFARLDLRIAKVELRRDLGGCWGTWRADGDRRTAIRGGREPRTEALVDSQGGSLQPVDFEYDETPTVVTGPNMGGKSALLALVGICQWCAQHACPVPADDFEFTPVSSVVYVGSEEPSAVDADRGLSSFGREVRRVVDALEASDPPVLWLLDEVGRGTHPDDGAALAADLLAKLETRGDRAVAATHFPALAEDSAFETRRIRGLDERDLADGDLREADTLDEIERILRDSMDFQPEPDAAGQVPHDARRVARALGLDLDDDR